VKYLLDTCVVSELISKSPNVGVTDWLNGQDSDHLFLSVVTIGEIQRGISKLSDTGRSNKLKEWLEDELMLKFDSRILPLDVQVMQGWGILIAGLEKIGLKMPVIDSLIAATAVSLSFTIVTRNVKDFDNSGVQLLNPWT
jgi:predicted nucleic acid-binding protein